MTRIALASALLLATLSTGCHRHHRARYGFMYGPPPPPMVVAVQPQPMMEAPPQAGPQPIIVHAPPGSVVIVNPQGGRPQIVRPQASEAPEGPEGPAEPQDQGWFQGER